MKSHYVILDLNAQRHMNNFNRCFYKIAHIVCMYCQSDWHVYQGLVLCQFNPFYTSTFHFLK